MFLSLFALLAMVSVASAQTTTLYVNSGTGIDGTGCGSVSSPCASITGGLTALGSNAGQLLVAAGTYSGALNAAITFATYNVAIEAVGGAVIVNGSGLSQNWAIHGGSVVVSGFEFTAYSGGGV